MHFIGKWMTWTSDVFVLVLFLVSPPLVSLFCFQFPPLLLEFAELFQSFGADVLFTCGGMGNYLHFLIYQFQMIVAVR